MVAGDQGGGAWAATERVLEIRFLGIGPDLEEVGHGHIAGSEHGNRQRRRGDRARVRGAA